MDKILINLEPVYNKTVKFGRYKIEVKPYLSTEDIASILQVCKEQFEFDDENYAIIKCIFDMLVVDKCTNVTIDGITTKKNKDKTNVSIDINSKKIAEFDASRIIDVVKPLVVNYDDAYSQLVSYIKIINVHNSFTTLGDYLPDGEELINNLQEVFKKLNEYKEKDPEAFSKIIQDSQKRPEIEKAQKEFKQNKSKNK